MAPESVCGGPQGVAQPAIRRRGRILWLANYRFVLAPSQSFKLLHARWRRGQPNSTSYSMKPKTGAMLMNTHTKGADRRARARACAHA